MTIQIHLKLNPAVSLAESGGGTPILCSSQIALDLGDPFPQLPLLLEKLTAGITQAELREISQSNDDPFIQVQVHYLIESLVRKGLVDHLLSVNGTHLASRTAVSEKDSVRSSKPLQDHLYQLSRFTYCQLVNTSFVVASPIATAQITLMDSRCLLIISELSKPVTCRQISTKIGCLLNDDEIEGFMGLLIGAGIAILNREENDFPPELDLWEFHDLLFHTRSRLGRHREPSGKTTQFIGLMPPSPAVKSIDAPLSRIPLSPPDLALVIATDPPFTQVLESRRSTRHSDSKPLTLEQLGEFLFRTCRARSIESRPLRSDPSISLDRTSRLYPSGGACYPLETYIIAHSCQNLDPGLYHYSMIDHHLDQIRDIDKTSSGLLYHSKRLLCQESPPPILLVLSARFCRTFWEHRSISYAMILKEVGALCQTLYLVATAMDLGCCLLGTGDSDLFSDLINTEYLRETSVAELALMTC